MENLLVQPAADTPAREVIQQNRIKRSFQKVIKPFFNPALAAAELMNPSHSYAGRRDALLAGVAAYTVYPRKSFALSAMRLRVMEIYSRQCEAIALNANCPAADVLPSSSEIWSPAMLRNFKKNVYDPLGGRDRMARTMSRSVFKTMLRKQSDRLDLALRIVEIWHFLTANEMAGSGTGRLLSIANGCELASTLGVVNEDGTREHLSARTLERAWKNLHESIALSYAASTIHLPNRGTILDTILEGKLTYSAVKTKFGEWFARATFVHDMILANLTPGKSAERFLDLTPLRVIPCGFSVPHFSNRDIVEMRTLYE